VAFFDLPLAELKRYLPDVPAPVDFDEFWRDTLAEVAGFPLDATFNAVDTPLAALQVFDVTFRGYGGQPVHGWLLQPRFASQPLPCVVEFVGYGGGRGYPTDWTLYASAGFAHLVMDTRSQGSVWRKGDTADNVGSGPQHPGFLTRGIESRHTYYYRRVFVDAVRAVEAARMHPGVDGSRVAAAGGSQGGGIALAVAALVPDVRAVAADVPFLCHYRRATEITSATPYAELSGYLRVHRNAVEDVFQVLSYFDAVNFARRAATSALFSAGLLDNVSPPSTIFAAFNHYLGPKEMCSYPYSGHEAGDGPHIATRLKFLQRLLAESK